jgi:HeH/LEM domain
MPSTLRAVDLRSLLLQHNVAYPMRATKPELVEIFKEQVIANASEILKNNKKTNTRSAFSQGIQDVDDTWSSGDEAPVNLIRSKEEISKAQVKSPKRSVVKEITSTSPKRTRKPKKLQLAETPKETEVPAKPEEQEQASQHVEEPLTGDAVMQEEDKESKTIGMAEKVNINLTGTSMVTNYDYIVLTVGIYLSFIEGYLCQANKACTTKD